MRILAIDYGDVKTGVAVSDPLGILATPVCVIKETKYLAVANEIMRLASDLKVEEIVIGNPLHMNGTAGERSKKTQKLQSLIRRKSKLPVLLIDERLTTVQAEQILTEHAIGGKKKKELVDTLAAMLILETYLQRKEKEPNL